MDIEEFLKEKFKDTCSIVLFGSYVRGEKFNDVDVLIIGNYSEDYIKNVKREFFQNLDIIYT